MLDTLIPHEEAEDRDVFPFLAKAVGNDDVTAALHRTHTEIFHLIRFTDRLVAEIPPRDRAPTTSPTCGASCTASTPS